MLADTHTQHVLDLANQKGLLRASDLDAIEAPRVVLCRRAFKTDHLCALNFDQGL